MIVFNKEPREKWRTPTYWLTLGEQVSCLLQGLLPQNKQTLFWEGELAPEIRVINVIDVVVREVFIS